MPQRRTRIIDNDKGWKALKASIDVLSRERPDVVVGITGSAAGKPRMTKKARSKRAKKAPPPPVLTNVTNAELAAWHEYGIGNPERSFLRSTFDLYKQRYLTYMQNGVRKELIAAVKARRTLRASDSATLKRLALRMEGDVKRRIGRREITPPNAPSTVRRKGSDTPLIDSGQLRQSITSEVRTGQRTVPR